MKVIGYDARQREFPIEKINFIELAEITVTATPDELRKLASFLSTAADNMEQMGDEYDHEHLTDQQPGFENSPHFVVSKL